MDFAVLAQGSCLGMGVWQRAREEGGEKQLELEDINQNVHARKYSPFKSNMHSSLKRWRELQLVWQKLKSVHTKAAHDLL